MLKKKLAGVALALTITTTSVQAQWAYQAVESAFDGDSQHIALTADMSGFGFGFRCINGNVEVLYLLPKDVSSGKKYEGVPFVLKIRVDKKPIVDLEAVVDRNDGQLRVTADADADLARAVQQAKTRVAVALEFLGIIMVEHSFSVNGSTKALASLLDACVAED